MGGVVWAASYLLRKSAGTQDSHFDVSAVEFGDKSKKKAENATLASLN